MLRKHPYITHQHRDTRLSPSQNKAARRGYTFLDFFCRKVAAPTTDTQRVPLGGTVSAHWQESDYEGKCERLRLNIWRNFARIPHQLNVTGRKVRRNSLSWFTRVLHGATEPWWKTLYVNYGSCIVSGQCHNSALPLVHNNRSYSSCKVKKQPNTTIPDTGGCKLLCIYRFIYSKLLGCFRVVLCIQNNKLRNTEYEARKETVVSRSHRRTESGWVCFLLSCQQADTAALLFVCGPLDLFMSS